MLGVGGTLRRLKDAGNEVNIVLLSYGRADVNDQMFDLFPIKDIAELVVEAVEEYKPDTVITHSLSDLNDDHRVVARATLIATRPQPKHCVKTVLACEILSATGWAFDARPTFSGNLFVDITGTLEAKVKALKEVYGEELRDWPHARSEQAVRALAAFRGCTVGVEAAEAFEVLRMVV